MEFKEKIERVKEVLEIVKNFPENLQIKVFDYLLNENYTIKEKADTNLCESKLENQHIQVNSIKKSKKKTTSQVGTSSYIPQLIKDLNLRPRNEKSLHDFFDEKKPDGMIQSTTVMAYYLEHILHLKDITPDHIFTCYRELNIKLPTAIVQNIRDCSRSRYGYLYFNNGKIATSVKGINFVEQDLPNKKDR